MHALALVQESAFLRFDYPEAIALARQFLTLISATLVFSVTFSDRIVRFREAPKQARTLLLFSWGGMITAIVFTGGALWLLYLAGVMANHGTSEVDFGILVMQWITVADWSTIFLNVAGVVFVASLAAMAGAAATVHRGSPEGRPRGGPTTPSVASAGPPAEGEAAERG